LTSFALFLKSPKPLAKSQLELDRNRQSARQALQCCAEQVRRSGQIRPLVEMARVQIIVSRELIA
jgi:hypothetical protein